MKNTLSSDTFSSELSNIIEMIKLSASYHLFKLLIDLTCFQIYYVYIYIYIHWYTALCSLSVPLAKCG